MDWNNNFYLKWGLTFVLMTIAGFLLLKSYGYASETTESYQQYYLRSNWSGKSKEVTQIADRAQKQKWQEMYDDHHYNAIRTYTDAYNKIWWLPDLTLRQLARDAWVAACSTAGGSTITARLVIAFTAMLSSYGLHCLDEWDEIQDKLYWSQFHFEKCKYYADLIHNS